MVGCKGDMDGGVAGAGGACHRTIHQEHLSIEAGTQTEPECVPVRWDAPCLPGSSRDAIVQQRPPNLVETSTQTEAGDDPGSSSRVQAVDAGGVSAPYCANDGQAGMLGHGQCVHVQSVAVQVSDQLMHTTRVQLFSLEEQLAAAQSTAIWQSVMLRCLSYDS